MKQFFLECEIRTLINHQSGIYETNIFAKDTYKVRYQILFNKREKIGEEYFKFMTTGMPKKHLKINGN